MRILFTKLISKELRNFITKLQMMLVSKLMRKKEWGKW